MHKLSQLHVDLQAFTNFVRLRIAGPVHLGAHSFLPLYILRIHLCEEHQPLRRTSEREEI